MTNFHNANNALRFLQGKGIDTSVGRVFLASDVEEAMKQDDEHFLGQIDKPRPKTMAQAKRMVRQDEEIMAEFEAARNPNLDLGEAVHAGPDSSSRT